MKNKHTIRVKRRLHEDVRLPKSDWADEDRWSAHYPALHAYEAATSGNTQEEALKHSQEVVQIALEGLLKERL
jgi:predicted RNase H-like HicB family nuclease